MHPKLERISNSESAHGSGVAKRMLMLGIALIYYAIRLIVQAGSRGLGRHADGGSNFVVLGYHSVKESERERFARQMEWLLEAGYAVKADFDGKGWGRGHYIAVTFDDGYRSIAENALPVMREKGVPATIFVVPHFLGGRPEWIQWPGHRNFSETLLTLEELRKLRDSGVTVGSHGLTHRPLAQLEAVEALAELVESKLALEGGLGVEVGLFAFPFGSVGVDTLRLSKEAGYKRVFLSEPLHPFKDAEGHVLGRIVVEPEDWKLEFQLKVRGAFNWLPLAIQCKAWLRGLPERILHVARLASRTTVREGRRGR